jgi:hypothetical protein
MVVLKIDLTDDRALGSEGQPMVARELQAPDASSIALEGMKPPAWNSIQFRDIFGFLDGSQHRAQLSLMLSRNSARLVMSPESLKLPVSETDDTHV